jgi:hypothetical protein
MIRYATDIYWENRETKIPYSYTNEPRGAYGIVNLMNMEQNIDFLTAYTKKMSDFQITGSLVEIYGIIVVNPCKIPQRMALD